MGSASVSSDSNGQPITSSESVPEDRSHSTNLTPAFSFSHNLHDYLRENIVLADQKAAFLFALVAAVLGYLHQSGVTRILLRGPCRWERIDILAFIAVVSLIVSAIYTLLVVKPRRKGSSKSIISWKAIAKIKDPNAYVERVKNLQTSNLAEAKLEHCHELACICRDKFKAAYVAFWSGTIGLAGTVTYLVFSSF